MKKIYIILFVVALMGCSENLIEKEEIELEFLELDTHTWFGGKEYVARFVSHEKEKYHTLWLKKYDYEYWELEPGDKIVGVLTYGVGNYFESEFLGKKYKVTILD